MTGMTGTTQIGITPPRVVGTTPTYSMPSKAYALAGEGRDPVGMHHRQSPYMDIQFIESHGAALASARLALYNSQGRKARERIHGCSIPTRMSVFLPFSLGSATLASARHFRGKRLRYTPHRIVSDLLNYSAKQILTRTRTRCSVRQRRVSDQVMHQNNQHSTG